MPLSRKQYVQNGLLPAQSAVVGMIEPGCRVLEVGCATGYMTRILKNLKGCDITVVEIDDEMAETASHDADRTIVGDVSNPEIWQQVGDGYDYVLYADVLEHLADPWALLRRTREVLSEKGQVIASIPNVAHYRIRLKLLFGNFNYKQYGILDDSHLRFFTAKTAKELFTSSGYDILEMLPANWRPIERLMMQLAPRAFAVQYVFRTRPSIPEQQGGQHIG